MFKPYLSIWNHHQNIKSSSHNSIRCPSYRRMLAALGEAKRPKSSSLRCTWRTQHVVEWCTCNNMIQLQHDATCIIPTSILKSHKKWIFLSLVSQGKVDPGCLHWYYSQISNIFKYQQFPAISRLFQFRLIWHVNWKPWLSTTILPQRLQTMHLAAGFFAKVHPWEWQLSKEWYQTRLKLPTLSQANFASPIHPRTKRWFQNHHSSPGTSMVLSILNLVGIWNRSPHQKPEHWLLPHLQS